MGFIDDDDLVEFLSQRYGVPAINLGEVEVDESIISIIPAEVARKYTILPVSKAGAKLTIAMVDPTNVFAMDDVKFMTGYNVEPVVASDSSLRASIDQYYGSTHSIELKKVMEDLTDTEMPIWRSWRRRRTWISRLSRPSRKRHPWCGWSTSS